MDINFYIPRGCYYLVENGGAPYWSLSGLSLNAPAWITNAQIQTADNVAKIPCFNNTKVAAIIGKNFGTATITGIALLGPNAESNFEGIFQASVESLRASNKGGSVNLSSRGGGAYKILVESYGTMEFAPELNILSWFIRGSVL